VKKRSKLDLAASENMDKSQAGGFGAAAAPDPEPDPQRSETRAANDSRQPRAPLAIKPHRHSRALIAVSVAVVAVAAVSFFVLKRR